MAATTWLLAARRHRSSPRGIGENSGDFRKLVLDRLGALGIKYNEEENAAAPEPRVISTEDSAIKVLVIPTNEEKAIAEATEEPSRASKSHAPRRIGG